MARTCLIGAGLVLAASFVPWPAAAQTGSSTSSSSDSARPRVFTSSASATALEFFPDRNNGFTIPEAARIRFAMGDSATSQSNGPTATAGVLSPGGGVTKGPGQICGLASGPVADNLPQLSFLFDACLNFHWPFSVDADEFQPDAATAGSTDIGQPNDLLFGQLGSAHARIDQETFASSTEASIGSLRLNPLPGAGSTGLPLPSLPLPGGAVVDPSVFSVGSLTASTSNAFDGQTLVAHAEAHVGGIRLLGGLVTIDSIASVAESRSADGQPPVGTSSVTVQGVTVAGQRASIGSDGVVIGDTGNGDPNALNSALNQLLNAAGISIRLIGANQEQTAAGIMNATATGVEIDFAHELDFKNTPLADLGLTDVYTAKLIFASVSAGDLARNITISVPKVKVGSTISPGSSTSTHAAGFSGGSAVGTPQAAPASEAPAATTATGERAGFLGIDPGRIKFLYLSFTLVALGLCISPRLTLPARFPGAA